MFDVFMAGGLSQVRSMWCDMIVRCCLPIVSFLWDRVCDMVHHGKGIHVKRTRNQH